MTQHNVPDVRETDVVVGVERRGSCAWRVSRYTTERYEAP